MSFRFLIIELRALHPPAGNIMLERLLVLPAVVQGLGISEVERKKGVGLGIARGFENRFHAIEQLLADTLGEIHQVVEIGVGAVHPVVDLERLQDILARLIQSSDRFQGDAVEVERLRAVRGFLERTIEHRDRLVVAVRLMQDLAEQGECFRNFRVLLEGQACRLLGRLQGVPPELDAGGQQQRLDILWSELQGVAENAQRLEVVALRDEQLGKVIVRFDVARVLLDGLAKRVLGLFKSLVLLQQRTKVVVNLRIDHALRQRFLISVQRAVDVADDA